MVQQATPDTGAEATPTLESPSPEVTEGDAPLVAPEPPAADTPIGEQGLVDQAGGAAPTEDTGAAEAETDTETGSEPEPSPEPEAEPAQTAATLTREEHEAELAKVRSGMDKRASDLEKQMQDLQRQAQEREAEYQARLSQQTYAAQVAAYQQQLAADYVSRGYSEEDAQRISSEQTKQAQTAYEYALQNQQLQQQLQQRTFSEEETNARVAARELAAEHGVHDDDVPLLLEAKTVDSMTALAKRLGTLTKQTTEATEQRRARVPAGANADLDAGAGDAGGMTDQQKIEAFSRGEYDNTEEVYGIMRKQGLL